jgi:hypothetical protein
MNIDYQQIPAILNVGTFQNPVPRGLRQFAEILNFAYRIFDHPLFQEDASFERIDPFKSAMDIPEMYKNFNRTVVERTIYQANYFSGVKVDNAVLTVSGQGIELAIAGLRDNWDTLNQINLQTLEQRRTDAANIHHFKWIAFGVFDAQLKFLLTTTQELLALVIKGHISDQLSKKDTPKDKYNFLIKWRADLLKQEEQFSESSFKAILKLIDIEWEVIEKLEKPFEVNTTLSLLVENFLKSQEAQISNDKLLKQLIGEQYETFQDSLKGLVMQLFSYHDITQDEPEKVYHSFLLGVFNSFSGVYELKSNKEAGLGRFDLLLTPYDKSLRGLIFEIKRSQTNNITALKKQACEALEQIRTNSYAVELRGKGVNRWVSFAAVFFGKVLIMDHELSENSN